MSLFSVQEVLLSYSYNIVVFLCCCFTRTQGPALIIPLGDPLMTLTDTIFIGQVQRVVVAAYSQCGCGGAGASKLLYKQWCTLHFTTPAAAETEADKKALHSVNH